MNSNLARFLAQGLRLTVAMNHALERAVQGKPPVASPRTWASLRRAGLVSRGTTLTRDGRQIGEAIFARNKAHAWRAPTPSEISNTTHGSTTTAS